MQQPALDFTSLRNAVASLEGALGVVGDAGWFDRQPEAVRRTLIAGVIQNFEFVYELSVKMVRRQLALEADSAEEVDQAGFREMLRMAAEKGLIEDVAAWFNWRRMRNLSAHTYDQEKAEAVYRDVGTFVRDARALLAALEGRHG